MTELREATTWGCVLASSHADRDSGSVPSTELYQRPSHLTRQVVTWCVGCTSPREAEEAQEENRQHGESGGGLRGGRKPLTPRALAAEPGAKNSGLGASVLWGTRWALARQMTLGKSLSDSEIQCPRLQSGNSDLSTSHDYMRMPCEHDVKYVAH